MFTYSTEAFQNVSIIKALDRKKIFFIFQVDIVRSKEETEKLANELMNIEIPNYKPSTNHVKLFEKGNVWDKFLFI